ncbi:MAG: 50S ribosomal protein L20 [Defluviitaleaceae bacterium]|nr:50S ribosomal protein L20 [Defluviitaleaceae bacterium]
MARIKGAMNTRKKHKKVLKMAKGFRGARSRQYRIAKQSVMRSMAHSFAGRKQTKRDYRKLWITRINAAARLNGISYSKLMNGLKLAGIDINRKMLADLAITDAAAFGKLAQTAKEKFS